MYCRNCGKELTENSEYCLECEKERMIFGNFVSSEQKTTDLVPVNTDIVVQKSENIKTETKKSRFLKALFATILGAVGSTIESFAVVMYMLPDMMTELSSSFRELGVDISDYFTFSFSKTQYIVVLVIAACFLGVGAFLGIKSLITYIKCRRAKQVISKSVLILGIIGTYLSVVNIFNIVVYLYSFLPSNFSSGFYF